MENSQKCINSLLPRNYLEVVHSCHPYLINEFLEVFKTSGACESIMLKFLVLYWCCTVSLLDWLQTELPLVGWQYWVSSLSSLSLLILLTNAPSLALKFTHCHTKCLPQLKQNYLSRYSTSLDLSLASIPEVSNTGSAHHSPSSLVLASCLDCTLKSS